MENNSEVFQQYFITDITLHYLCSVMQCAKLTLMV